MEAVYDAIITGLRHLDHVRDLPNRYLIGASGGIDSSVVACLLTRAVGAERVALELLRRAKVADALGDFDVLLAADVGGLEFHISIR